MLQRPSLVLSAIISCSLFVTYRSLVGFGQYQSPSHLNGHASTSNDPNGAQSPVINPAALIQEGQTSVEPPSSPPLPPPPPPPFPPSPLVPPQDVNYEHVVEEETIFLQDASSFPLDPTDLSGLGQRVASFARLLKALLADPSIPWATGQDLFTAYFSWWQPPTSTYDPWYDGLESFSPDPVNPREPQATGIVMCISNNDVDVAAHTIGTVKWVMGSALSIEVAFAGDSDLSPESREKLLKIRNDLHFVNLTVSFDENVVGLEKGPRNLKTFAALNSRFEKVIILDAGVVFLQPPDEYFDDHPRLKETGTLYFHDRALKETERITWAQEILNGKKPSMELEQSIFWQEGLRHQQQSGVVFIDKGVPSAFMGLLFATYMNTWEVRSRLIHNKFRVDEEAFWLASELSSAPYAFSPSYAGIIGYQETVLEPDSSLQQKICSQHQLHLGLDDKPLWFNSGLRRKKKEHPDEVIDRELEDFTHWVKAGITREQQPSWTVSGHNEVCVHQNDMVQKIPRVVIGSLHTLKVEAKRDDSIILGPKP